MISLLDRLRNVASKISLGAFRPAMSLEVTTKVTSDGEFPAVLIGIDAKDATSDDGDTIRLYECHIVPNLDSDRALALYIYERCQDILLHEMDEFIRFEGKPLVVAKHPVSDDVYTSVRARQLEVVPHVPAAAVAAPVRHDLVPGPTTQPLGDSRRD